MKKWFTSLNGAISLAVLAYLALLARGMGIDALFVMQDELGLSQDQPGMVAVFILWTVAVFGGWLWALLGAARGGRIGLIATLIFCLLSGLMGGFTVLEICSNRCAAWPVGDIVIWAEFIFGLVASVALGLQLRAGQMAQYPSGD